MKYCVGLENLLEPIGEDARLDRPFHAHCIAKRNDGVSDLFERDKLLRNAATLFGFGGNCNARRFLRCQGELLQQIVRAHSLNSENVADLFA